MIGNMRREEHALEHLDRPLPPAALAASLADLERLNTLFGGHRLTVRAVARRIERLSRHRRVVVLDVGGGRGDLALRLVAWARRARRQGAPGALHRAQLPVARTRGDRRVLRR